MYASYFLQGIGMGDVQLTVRISDALADRLNLFLNRNPACSRSSAIGLALDAFLPARAQQPSESKTGRAPPGAGQDKKSGREGRDFGVSAGRSLAEKLGSLVSPTATELDLKDGRRATIRTARNRNTQWGCLDSVLDRVDVVICAYTKDDRKFQLWQIGQQIWRREARSASRGHKLYGKLTIISKSTAERFGERLPDQSL